MVFFISINTFPIRKEFFFSLLYSWLLQYSGFWKKGQINHENQVLRNSIETSKTNYFKNFFYIFYIEFKNW